MEEFVRGRVEGTEYLMAEIIVDHYLGKDRIDGMV